MERVHRGQILNNGDLAGIFISQSETFTIRAMVFKNLEAAIRCWWVRLPGNPAKLRLEKDHWIYLDEADVGQTGHKTVIPPHFLAIL